MSGTPMSDAALTGEVSRLEQTMTTGGGWQDQAGGVFPGAKIVTSGPGLRQRLRVEPIGWTVDREREFSQRLTLYNTGLQRMAKNLLRQVVASYLARETATVQALHGIKTLAVEMAFAMRDGEWSYLGELLDRHWRLNQILDPHTTNAPIDNLLARVRPYVSGAKLAGSAGALVTIIAPLCPRTMPATAASPSPRPVNFVEKKGSKILALVASSMPQPVSRTSRQIYGPGGSSAASGWRRVYCSSTS